ncbi:MAG: ABC transporter ATP-binding protein, partial [Armatimonadota bacterium]
MALLETIPDTLAKAVESATHRSPAAGIVAVRADLDRNGRLAEHWIFADTETVRTWSDNDGTPGEIASFSLCDASGVRTETLVGGGALLLERGSDILQIARYTTPLAGRMAGVARLLDAVAKGKDLPEAGLDDIERTCAKCGRALPKDTDVCRYCFDKRATLLRLLSYASPYRWHAVALLALMLAGTWASLVPGIIVRDLTDKVLLPKVALPDAQRLADLGWLVAGFVGSQILGTLIGIVRGRLSAFLSINLTFRIRARLYDKIQQLGLSYYDKRQTGTILTRVTQDVNELNNFLVDGLQILVVNGLMIAVILAILLSQNALLTGLVLVPVPLVILTTTRVWRFLWGRLERLWNLRSQMASGINSALSGARVVKAFAQESREIDRFLARAGSLRSVNLDLENWWATLFPILGLVMMSGLFVVWYVGGRDVIGGRMTLGTLNLFFFYLGQLYGPLQGMTRIADWLSRALTSAERVFEVMDTVPDVADAPDATPLPRIQGAVTFERVAFGYDKARRVLEEFDLTVKPGEMIGLVGHSGAGKTTVINLIARFYDPNEGRLLIDGHDMRSIRLHDLRSQMGIVLQEPFLFPGTIAENIAYAKPDAPRDDILRAAKAANAHDFVMRFADGYDTQVGERGARLSGGERQRLSIARAILHDPRILILDEATASVDTETEKQIQEAIQRLITGRTTFAIAHRLSTLRHADRLVVVERGRIAEVGTHDELMHKENGIFRRLVEMQTE